MAITLASGTPVYPPLSWDSVGSWALGLGMLLLATGFYAGLYYLTKCKFRKMAMHDSINYTTTSSTMEPESNTIEIEHEENSR